MNIVRTIYHLVRKPYYPTTAMADADFDHLCFMLERQMITAGFITKNGGKRILEIGGGLVPLYEFIKDSSYSVYDCVDPVITDEVSIDDRTHLYPVRIDEFEANNPQILNYDTIVLLGMGCTMGKESFDATKRIVHNATTRCFILEYCTTWVNTIYSSVLTKNLRTGWKQQTTVNLTYPGSYWHSKRRLEVWIR